MRANIKLFDVFASLHIEPYLVFSVAVVRRNVKQQNLEEGPITSVSRVCTNILHLNNDIDAKKPSSGFRTRR